LLRKLTGAPWVVRNDQLHKNLDLQTVRKIARVLRNRISAISTLRQFNSSRNLANNASRHLRLVYLKTVPLKTNLIKVLITRLSPIYAYKLMLFKQITYLFLY